MQGSQVDVNYYTKGFNVYKSPASSDTITITAGTNTCYDKSTGVTSNCAVASPTWDNLNSKCNNAVYKISWKVSYSVSSDGDVTIDSIVADTILSSFKVSSYSTTDLGFSISFVQVSIIPSLKIIRPLKLMNRSQSQGMPDILLESQCWQVPSRQTMLSLPFSNILMRDMDFL